MITEEINSITYDIIGAAFDVRRECGPGLLESYYEAALEYELKKRGRRVFRQVYVDAYYKDEKIKDPYKIDMLVDDEVVVELKSHSIITGTEISQLLTYLYLTKKKIGLLTRVRDKKVIDIKES